MLNLTPQELERYNRQMLIEGWGKEGQLKLKNSTVFVAGVGKTLKNKMFLLNGQDMSVNFVKLRRDPNCISCGGK